MTFDMTIRRSWINLPHSYSIKKKVENLVFRTLNVTRKQITMDYKADLTYKIRKI